MQFEKNLCLLRKKNNLSQEELAFLVGVSRQTIYSWEAGLNYPNIIMLKKLADSLNVSTDDLLNGFKVNKFKDKINDLKLTLLKKHDGNVYYDELPNWFIKLKKDEEVCWALYDYKGNMLIRDYSYEVNVLGDVLVHDKDGIEIEVKEYDEKLDLRRKYNQFVSISNNGVAWIGEDYYKDNKRVIKTFHDQDFLDDWGIGGKFMYQEMHYNEAMDYVLELDNKKYNVIKISYFDPDGRNDDKAAYFEVFLNQDLESLVWRRFTKVSLKSDYTNFRVNIDDEEYDLDYYALTSRLY
ncbi:MAG: helix-turn-helix transcriptional regulator [Bacilli bacterium]|nr:helix-turn-helix transcriptional regulator [Bacilli bacterium]